MTSELRGEKMIIAGQYASTRYTGTISVNWNNGNVQRIVLANGANSITLSNPLAGGRYILILVQPAGGAAGTVTWPGTVAWPAGTAPTLTATNSKTDIIGFIYDDVAVKYFGSSSLNY